MSATGKSNIKLDNASGTTINPATEDGNLATLTAKDFATETTLAGIKTGTDKIPASPATEGGNLATIASNTSDVATETTLAALAAEDFATETTLAAMSAKLPATLGQKTAAASLAVVLASDQPVLEVTRDGSDLSDEGQITSDTQLIAATPGLRLSGFSVADITSGAEAFVILRHGTLATDPIITAIRIGKNETVREQLPDIEVASGIFADWQSGQMDIQLYTKTIT